MVECRVTFEYERENDDELTLRVGDIVTDVDQQDGGWWEGTLNGCRGVFPDNFVEVIQKSAPPVRPPDPGKAAKKEWRAKVTFSYVAANDDELDLEVGDEVVVTNQEEEGWWEGEVHGRKGVFPSNFVETISEESSSPLDIKETPKSPDRKVSPAADETEGQINPPREEDARQIQPQKVVGVGFGNIFSGGPIKLQKSSDNRKGAAPPPPGPDQKKRPAPGPPGGHGGPAAPLVLPPQAALGKKKVEKCKVTFDYAAEAEDELSLKVGEIVEILRKDVAEGWWEGKLGGKVGVFPDNFVELIQEEEKKPPPPVQMPAVSLKPVEKPEEKPPEKVVVAPVRQAVKPPPPKPAPSGKPAPPVGRKPPPVATKKPEEKSQAPGVRKPLVGPPKKPDPPQEKVNEETTSEKPPEKKDNDLDSVEVPLSSKLKHPTVDRPRSQARPPSRYVQKKEEEEAKPPPSGDGAVAPWQRELQKKRSASGSSIAHKPEDEKRESPAPEKPTPVTTTQPPVSKPASSALATTTQPSVSKPTPSAPVTTTQPAVSKPAPKSPTTASQVGSEELAALQRDLDATKQEIASIKKTMEENIEKLESELDEEKMERMKLQVEVDRLKKKNPIS